jgi:hypothetical protein
MYKCMSVYVYIYIQVYIYIHLPVLPYREVCSASTFSLASAASALSCFTRSNVSMINEELRGMVGIKGGGLGRRVREGRVKS